MWRACLPRWTICPMAAPAGSLTRSDLSAWPADRQSRRRPANWHRICAIAPANSSLQSSSFGIAGSDEAFAQHRYKASGMFVDPDRVHPINHEGPLFWARCVAL